MLKKVKKVFSKDKSTKCVVYDEEKNENSFQETSQQTNKNSEQQSQVLNYGKSKFYKEKQEEEHATVQGPDTSIRTSVLWAESHEVINSGILAHLEQSYSQKNLCTGDQQKNLSNSKCIEMDHNKCYKDNMTMYERALQETKFEIITTELKHLNSLNMLIAVFYQCKHLSATCTREEWENLFSNIRTVKDASELLLSDLLVHWQNDIMLTGIYGILRNHATSILRVYVNYCSNQPLANHTLNTLVNKNEEFRQTLERIEESQNETLQAFLTVPIQRVTRLPLLLEAVITRLDQSTAEYTACRLAISTFKQLANECNEAVIHHKFSKNSSDVNMTVKSEVVQHSNEFNQQTKTKRKPTWSSSSSWSV